MTNVSIIIVNYNTVHLVTDAIRSVVEQTAGVSYEVIVVDNNSKDDAATVIHSQFPNVNVLALDENLGFGKANNAGAGVAIGRNLLFLNPDTILRNNAVKILSDYLDSHTDVGACGGNLFNADGEPAHSFKRVFPSVISETDAALKGIPFKIRYGNNTDFNHTGKPLEVAYVCGADLMVKRELFESCGGFDKDIFMYYEDSLLCHTISKNKKKIVSLPEAEITHLEGKSFNLNEKREEMIFRGREVFFSKVYSTAYHKTANAVNKVLLFIAIALYKALGKKELAGKFKYRYTLYKNKR